MMRSLFDTVLLREQLKRFWAIGVLLFLAYFLGILLPLWGATFNDNAVRAVLMVLEMSNPIVIFSNIIAPLAAAFGIFSYMYRKNSAGVLHALPFTKRQLFATNFLAGYILIAVPLVIFSALLLIMPVTFSADPWSYQSSVTFSRWIAVNVFPHGLFEGQIINTLPVVAGFLGRTLLSYTFYYILFVAAAMVVGNQPVHILVSGLLPFLALILYSLFGFAAYYYVFGYTFSTDPMERILQYTNPVLIPTAFTRNMSDLAHLAEVKSLTRMYMTYILTAAALLALSVWLYHTRKLERAGDTVVFTPIKNFFIFLLSVGGMVVMGMFLLTLMGSVAALYLGFVLGFVIAFFIAQMIAEQSLNVLYKYKSLLRHGGVALGLFIVIIAATRADITGYERFTPAPANIEGVRLGFFSQHSQDMHFISDPEIINEMLAVHQRIIDGRHGQRHVFLADLSRDWRGRQPSIYQQMAYRLNDETVVRREYRLSNDFAEEVGLLQLLNREPVILADVPWIRTPELIYSVNIEPQMIITVDEDDSRFGRFSDTVYLGQISITDR
ncbi:MAG: hypothetical protein FWE68_03065, partial [Defluviitaleaceae bacterium]|nr:hypothetical protein [Defluviitaleaceae bacterium]